MELTSHINFTDTFWLNFLEQNCNKQHYEIDEHKNSAYLLTHHHSDRKRPCVTSHAIEVSGLTHTPGMLYIHCVHRPAVTRLTIVRKHMEGLGEI